jgi:hypothetical protein
MEDKKTKGNLDELKNQVSKILQTEKPEELTSELYVFFRLLTPEESALLQLLINSPTPLSIWRIRKKFAIDIAEKLDMNLLSQIPIIKEEIEKKGLKPDKQTIISILRNIPEVKFEKIISFINSFNLENLIEETPSVFVPSSNLRRKPTKIFFYFKVKKMLEEFEKLGIVSARKLESGKADYIYSISPQFLKKCMLVIDFLSEKEKNKGLTQTERELLDFLMGR